MKASANSSSSHSYLTRKFLLLLLVGWYLFLSPSYNKTRRGGVLVVAASPSSDEQRELDQTPTWAVSGFCAVMIIISIFWEQILHKVGKRLRERQPNAPFEAFEKVKAELMLVGFISLLLNFTQDYVANICIPKKVADTMLPCRSPASADNTTKSNAKTVPIISLHGLHQLHLLIFFLAFLHVTHSLIAMMLGRRKIHGWKEWEQETSSADRELPEGPSRFCCTPENYCVRCHTTSWTRVPFVYIGCFFRQFFKSVRKSDYLTLRNQFITVHLTRGSRFNFQNYIKGSLDDDFKVVVGVSPVLWASFLLNLLLNVGGWEALFWASLIPAIIILAVGTKLQVILTQMTGDIEEGHARGRGTADEYFWFGRPQLVLHVIHFALFQNAFQTTYFFWISHSFGLKSCFHSNFKLAIIKVLPGVGVLIVCGYITLPLYALVAQMSSQMKESILNEQTSRAPNGEGGNSHTEAVGERELINNKELPGGRPIINNSLPGSQPIINTSLSDSLPGTSPSSTIHSPGATPLLPRSQI